MDRVFRQRISGPPEAKQRYGFHLLQDPSGPTSCAELSEEEVRVVRRFLESGGKAPATRLHKKMQSGF
ncbi:hypothetical protein EDC64_104193 [Aquabacter spiritensis]|uniref:Uncharacterized protein n=1 Tax=Aquabacter spiritensis TaxID=933073 RepID=A0A4R3LZB1_9HYPH|nr:hypothetical protein EDC64_104193 [Aquabacter spiritensis]